MVLNKLEHKVTTWLDNHSIISSKVDVESNILGTNICFQYFGEKLPTRVVCDFEKEFKVQKKSEKINLLGYKNYDVYTGEYVDISNCQYIFSLV